MAPTIKAVYVGYSVPCYPGTFDQCLENVLQAGFNLIALAFWIDPTNGPDPPGAAAMWVALTPTQRTNVLTLAHNTYNAKIIVSCGGSSYGGNAQTDYILGQDVAYGTGVANFVNTYNLDGADFDFEGFLGQFTTPSGLTTAQAISWCVTATTTAYNLMPPGSIITHAPQAPFFVFSNFASGYTQIAMQIDSILFALLIQYYNQGTAYLDYAGQFIEEVQQPQSAIAGLVAQGLPIGKLVIGRPIDAPDAGGGGYVDPAVIHQWFVQASTDPAAGNWATGFSLWQWRYDAPTAADFLQTVYP